MHVWATGGWHYSSLCTLGIIGSGCSNLSSAQEPVRAEMALSRSLLFFVHHIIASGYGMRKQYKKKFSYKKNSAALCNALPLCGSRRDSRGLLGSLSGLRERMRGAPYATTPRAIRPIPENRDSFRTTVSVASLERENAHLSASIHRPDIRSHRDAAMRNSILPPAP